MATDRGKALIYRGGDQGKVIFDGKVHAGKGFSCRECHTDLQEKASNSLKQEEKVLFPALIMKMVPDVSHATTMM